MKHWTENDFKQWLYGLKEEDAHLEECRECRAELERLSLERGRILAPPEVSPEFLAEQRRNIYRRLDAPIRNWAGVRWALSVAMLVVVLGITLRLSHKSAPSISDEQLFSDLASIEQSAEPKAIEPIHKLFEE